MDRTRSDEKKIAHLLKEFGEDWELRAATREIARKNKVWYLNIWQRQHQVMIMYQWTKINWSQFSNQSLPFPLGHDHVPKEPGQPILFALLGGWTIPEDDLKYLTGGPLYNENWEQLVPEKSNRWKTVLLKSGKTIFWATVISVVAWVAYRWLNNHF